MSTTTPSWPSLYNPGLEILHIEHRPAMQPGGAYLYRADDIFRFTFYWTLIFYTPFFFVCGFYAFCNYTFPPHPSSLEASPEDSDQSLEEGSSFGYEDSSPRRITGGYIPLQILRSRRSEAVPITPTSLRPTAQKSRKNARRSRVAFALLVFLVFLAAGLAGAVIGSAVLSFTVMGMYRSANFNMSTWIPFLLALLQVLVGLLSVWPSIIEII